MNGGKPYSPMRKSGREMSNTPMTGKHPIRKAAITPVAQPTRKPIAPKRQNRGILSGLIPACLWRASHLQTHGVKTPANTSKTPAGILAKSHQYEEIQA